MTTAEKIEALVLGYLGAGVTETEFGRIERLEDSGYRVTIDGFAYAVTYEPETVGWSVIPLYVTRLPTMNLLEAARLAVGDE